MADMCRVAEVEEIPQGESKVVRVGAREVALFHTHGTFYAAKNSCPHRGISLERSGLDGPVLTCPGHGWRFDLPSGDSLGHPPAGRRCYRVEVRGGSVWVEVPSARR